MVLELVDEGCGTTANVGRTTEQTRMKRLTPHELQEQVDRLFNGRLVLKDITYVYANDTLQIQCNVCDTSFTRRRKELLAGKGCPTCAQEGRRISAQTKFLEESRERHGSRYDYSLVTYRSNKEPVLIICNQPGHATFQQRPEHHRKGHGCPKCSGVMPRTLDSFIAAARERHGGRFDYSEVLLTNMRTNVTIICSRGHRFEQAPYSHLAGNGCPFCVGMGKTTEDFIREATAVHANRYIYDSTVYVSAKAPLEVTCRKHGSFTQIASAHLQGNGCPECGGTQKLTEEVFFERAREKHNGRFDYKRFVFSGYAVSSTIVCPEHGPFQQSPKLHLRHGCPRCGRKAVASQCSSSRDAFVEKSRSIHGQAYEYDEVIYTTNKHKVVIRCSKHGQFRQSPTNHLKGHGCPKCARGQFLTQQAFVEQACRKHNGRYQYSRVTFISSSEPVTITCPYHGDFSQRPSDHLRGRGCARCNMSRGECEVQRVLLELGVNFQWQWQSPTESKQLRKLRWDFCIVDDRATPLGLIEFQGDQHFHPVAFGTSEVNDRESAFAAVVRRDQQKRNHANELGVPLLELTNASLPSLDKLIREFAAKVGAIPRNGPSN